MTYLIAIGIQMSLVMGQSYFHPGYQSEDIKPVPLAKPVDLAFTGRHAQAMVQAKELLVALKANNWSPIGIPKSLCRLPDQDFAEEPTSRGPQCISFALGRSNGLSDSEFMDGIAFYSTLYVSRVKRDANGKVGTKQQPHGFFIVGYKSGQVKKVPYEDVRYMPLAKEKNASSLVFPGTKAYTKAFKTPAEAFVSRLSRK